METPTVPTRSIAQMHAKFCDHWRRNVSDDEFLAFVRVLCAKDGQDQKRRREVIAAMLSLKPGEIWYDVSIDANCTMIA